MALGVLKEKFYVSIGLMGLWGFWGILGSGLGVLGFGLGA